MRIDFPELKCPSCGEKLVTGNVTLGIDTQVVKKCSCCDFTMVILIPNKDYEYSIKRKHKLEPHE